eukprot:TRINITY_DN19502_c0_g1_i2.p1 TRINITY_DN19502_c0_g1~~TRINITY_DN19502_c0_g1_i2.p1  ORF type:complete len:252 (-),score=54.33 TRINITY_DN19502_c0_g1_i2:47-802(-)
MLLDPKGYPTEFDVDVAEDITFEQPGLLSLDINDRTETENGNRPTSAYHVSFTKYDKGTEVTLSAKNGSAIKWIPSGKEYNTGKIVFDPTLVSGAPNVVTGEEEVSYVVLGVTDQKKVAALAACGNFELGKRYMATQLKVQPSKISNDTKLEAEITLPDLKKGKRTYYAFIASRVYLKQIDEVREYRYTMFKISYQKVSGNNTWPIIFSIGIISCLLIIVGYIVSRCYRQRTDGLKEAELTPELLNNKVSP